MPQPMRKWKDIELEPTALERRPKMAVAIAKISAQWSHIEASIGHLLATMLGTDATSGIIMYLALTSTASTKAVLRAIAESALEETDLNRFEEISKEISQRALERNKLVHAIWGTAKSHPDSLIRVPVENIIQTVAALYAPQPNIDFSPENWVLEDFEDISARIERLSSELEKFIQVVRKKLARRPKSPPLEI